MHFEWRIRLYQLSEKNLVTIFMYYVIYLR
jgi:hypothetical protein